MTRAASVPSKAILATLVLIGATAETVAQDPKTVHYTCADGTRLQARFSSPGIAAGSVRLMFAGLSTEATLPQVLSADGGRYLQGDVEFWIKGRSATLTRAGKSTTCQTGN